MHCDSCSMQLVEGFAEQSNDVVKAPTNLAYTNQDLPSNYKCEQLKNQTCMYTTQGTIICNFDSKAPGQKQNGGSNGI